MGMPIAVRPAVVRRIFLVRFRLRAVLPSRMFANTYSQVGAGHAGDAGQRRLDTEFADLQDALGIDARLSGEMEHLFIACAFAFRNHARAQPPGQRMKPEDGLRKHVNGCCEIVSSAYMTDLVHKDCFEGAHRSDGRRFRTARSELVERCGRCQAPAILGKKDALAQCLWRVWLRGGGAPTKSRGDCRQNCLYDMRVIGNA
jgi:hypothetical protein